MRRRPPEVTPGLRYDVRLCGFLRADGLLLGDNGELYLVDLRDLATAILPRLTRLYADG